MKQRRGICQRCAKPVTERADGTAHYHTKLIARRDVPTGPRRPCSGSGMPVLAVREQEGDKG